MTYRDLGRWKSWFYGVVLPALRGLSPARADAVLVAMGRASRSLPGGRSGWAESIAGARAALGAGWNPDEVASALASNWMRFAARDYLLDGLDAAALADRFEVTGYEPVRAALARGQGLILLGSHLGGYLSALHWLYRQGTPLRLLVQRPRHVSRTLEGYFDADGRPHPQRTFFLRLKLPREEATRRVLQARDALRAGQAVYLNGDIPWPSCNARPGRLLGRDHEFLAIWADLAAVTGSMVVPLFCTHRANGRFALDFTPAVTVELGRESEGVQRYLERLESVIRAHPADAIPHLTWPAYREPPETAWSRARGESAVSVLAGGHVRAASELMRLTGSRGARTRAWRVSPPTR